MALLVDGDACPDLMLIKKIALKKQVEMIVYVDYAHYIQDDYFKTIICDVGKDSCDLNLLNDLKEGDLVITQDYGLASLALGKGAKVIHVSGKMIDEDNIDELLMSRYISSKQRKAKVHIKGPGKRSKAIQQQFLKQLKRHL